jgi:hypothetical protein
MGLNMKKGKQSNMEKMKKIYEAQKRDYNKMEHEKQRFIDEALSKEDAKGLTIYERTKKRVENLQQYGSLLFDYFDPDEAEYQNLFDMIFSMELAKEMDNFLSTSKKYFYGTIIVAIISIVLAAISIIISFSY